MRPTEYKHVTHATHAESGGGWDLERWDVTSSERPEAARRGAGVPADAEYHSGYRDAAGCQHWVYLRKAPFTPDPACSRCNARLGSS